MPRFATLDLGSEQERELEAILGDDDEYVLVARNGPLQSKWFKRSTALALAAAVAFVLACSAVYTRSAQHAGQAHDRSTDNEIQLASACAVGAVNCAASQCCATPGWQCFQKDDYYSGCKPACPAGWYCNGKPQAAVVVGVPAPAPAAGCAWNADNCKKSGCCGGAGLKCLAKDDFYSGCKPACPAGWCCNGGCATAAAGQPAAGAPTASWNSGTIQGQPLPANLQGNGGQSMFCFSVVMSDGYEPWVLEVQFKSKTSIFACSAYMVLSPSGQPLHGIPTTGFQNAATNMGGALTTSWVNHDTFISAWSVVHTDGRYKGYQWTIKSDPDAVFFPAVLAGHLWGKSGPVYFSNCPGVAFGMYGSLEVISSLGFSNFFDNIENCKWELPDYAGMGEDLFAQKCMDRHGVQKIDDFSMVADGNCGHPPHPCKSGAAAFHPLKTGPEYEQCIKEAANLA